MVPLVLAGFDSASWYAAIVYVVGGLLVLLAAVREVRAGVRWARGKMRPEPVPDPELPDVVIGHPAGSMSYDASGETRSLAIVQPSYVIENKEPSLGIRDVVTGVRTRDGRSQIFEAFYAGLIAAGEKAPVQNIGSIRRDFLDEIHESAAWTAFLYWARFTKAGTRWEVVYDPETRRNTYSQVPPTHPELHARVERVDDLRHNRTDQRVIIENTGDVSIERVEIDLPPEAESWAFIFDVLPSYPVPALEPGDTAVIPIFAGVGSPGAIEVVLRGSVDGVPYQRPRTLSLFG